jgi:DNA-binding CsgD family transcriptional regulator
MKRRDARPVLPRLAHGLETSGAADPCAIRRQLFEALLTAVGADAVGFSGFSTDGKAPLIAYWQAIGDPAGAELLRRVQEAPPEELARICQEDGLPPAPLPEQLRAFVEDSRIMPRERMRDGRYHERFCRPLKINSYLQLCVPHGRQILGSITLFRKEGAPIFSARDRRRVAPLVERAIASAVVADTLERGDLPDGAGYLLATPEGRVEYSSDEARPWLAVPGFRDGLARWITALDRQQPERRVALGASVKILRLDGAAGVRYLAALRPLPPYLLAPAAGLTPRQREIAEYAAAGATIREIAAATGCAADTVRTHLRAVYRRLAVSSRLELAWRLYRD